MIPHDDDVDTAILAKDEPLFRSFIPMLEEQGFVVTLHEVPDQGSGEDVGCKGKPGCQVLKYPPARYYSMTYSSTNTVHLDVAVLCSYTLSDGTDILVDAPPGWVDTLEEEEVQRYTMWVSNANKVLPPVPCTYLGVRTYCPRNIHAYLVSKYGPDYLTPHNRDNHMASPRPVDLLINHIQPSHHVNASIGIAPVLIINHPRDVERLHHLLEQCEEEQLYASRLNQYCQGASLEQESRFVRNTTHPDLVNLSGSQKACFLSHEECWKIAARDTLPTLVLEDDCSLPFKCADYVQRITRELAELINQHHVPPSTVVRLGMGEPNVRIGIDGEDDTLVQFRDTCFATTDRLVTGAWAYIVTPAAARTLLHVSSQNNLQWPSDHFFNVPTNRESLRSKDHRSGEHRLPGPQEYMFLELWYPAFKDLRQRYTLGVDSHRHVFIQELSTELLDSRSSGM